MILKRIKRQREQRRLKFNDYKYCLLNNEIKLSERHNVNTEEVNKIALSSDDDKRC